MGNLTTNTNDSTSNSIFCKKSTQILYLRKKILDQFFFRCNRHKENDIFIKRLENEVKYFNNSRFKDENKICIPHVRDIILLRLITLFLAYLFQNL